MTTKRVIRRAEARRDVEDTVDCYVMEAGNKIALSFVDEVQRTYRQIARYPLSGSTRYAHDLDIPGLRFWPLKRFPFLVFYIETDAHIEVWRVLHAERDIPAWMYEKR